VALTDLEIESLVREFTTKFGADELRTLLKTRVENLPQEPCLTIICDDSLHEIPSELIVGESFVFSSGNFDTTSGSAVRTHIERCVLALSEVLNAKPWKRVRIIFSGHAILSATAKFVVYRITHIETDDVLYFGGIGYLEVGLRLRNLLAQKDREIKS
jgi:hypothetical protein